MADLCYRLIRSDRKTVALQLKGEELIVRAPARMKQCDIDAFVRAHADWIEKHRAKIREEQKKTEDIPLLSNEELHALADKALAVIPSRVGCEKSIFGQSEQIQRRLSQGERRLAPRTRQSNKSSS